MRAIVLGAGPAGCAAATALHRAGFDVAVYERDAVSSRRSGGGLYVCPNGFAALDALGLPRSVVAAAGGFPLEAMTARCGGTVGGMLDLTGHAAAGYPFATVLRVEFAAAIRAALPAGVPVVCGAPATAVREVDGGRRAAVSFGGGVPE